MFHLKVVDKKTSCDKLSLLTCRDCACHVTTDGHKSFGSATGHGSHLRRRGCARSDRGLGRRLGARSGAESPSVVVQIQSGAGALDDSIVAIRRIVQMYPGVPLLFVAYNSSEALAVAAFRAGATDYLGWPVLESEFNEVWARALKSRPLPSTSAVLVGDSPGMRRVRESLQNLAATPCSVLLSGETGTGKDVAARLLHDWSARTGSPYLSINCAAVPETLVEAELFGYERGAFTGAQSSSPGKLAAANGGTVFLDEIGELSFSAQAKLLRTIEQREIQRLGALRGQRIDVRWVVASNRNLEQMSHQGRFRADLYYRLNVAEIAMPALRDHLEDIPALVEHFLAFFAVEYGWRAPSLSSAASTRLCEHNWPGNVRELRNVVESSLIRARGDVVQPNHLPPALNTVVKSAACTGADERDRLIQALRSAGGNKSRAAQRLQWSRMTLYRKMTQYGIDVTSRDTPVTAPPSQE